MFSYTVREATIHQSSSSKVNKYTYKYIISITSIPNPSVYLIYFDHVLQKSMETLRKLLRQIKIIE